MYNTFYTSMNLHCSQTLSLAYRRAFSVLYLYEFTLLSNYIWQMAINNTVLYLYEFTLLSNVSNVQTICKMFYTSMNLHCSQTCIHCRFHKKKFYTSMNLHCSQTSSDSLIPLIVFYTSMNLHCSQTHLLHFVLSFQFYTSMNLHCSQTYRTIKR